MVLALEKVYNVQKRSPRAGPKRALVFLRRNQIDEECLGRSVYDVSGSKEHSRARQSNPE